MKNLIYCIKKDLKEFTRCKKGVICWGILISVLVVVMGVTALFPFLINNSSESVRYMMSDFFIAGDMMEKIFPDNVKDSLGIFSADVVLFYVIAVSVMCGKIVPDEIKKGKWIIPLNTGYEEKELLVSKCIVYGMRMSIPAFIMYNVYYFISIGIMKNNIDFLYVFVNSTVMAFTVFSAAVIVILLSAVYMQGISASVTVIVTVVAVPDMLVVFSFGKFLPTYIFSYLYDTKENVIELIIPIIETIILIIFFGKMAIDKTNRNEIKR